MIFYSIEPQNFQGTLAFRKSQWKNNIHFSQFSSLWLLLWQRLYADKLSTWDFLVVFIRHCVDMRENTEYINYVIEWVKAN